MKKTFLMLLGILILIGVIAFLITAKTNSKIISLSLNESYYFNDNTYIIFIKHTPECLKENEDCYNIGIFDILNQETNGNLQSFSNGTFYLRMEESKTISNVKISLVNITGSGLNAKAYLKIN